MEFFRVVFWIQLATGTLALSFNASTHDLLLVENTKLYSYHGEFINASVGDGEIMEKFNSNLQV